MTTPTTTTISGIVFEDIWSKGSKSEHTSLFTMHDTHRIKIDMPGATPFNSAVIYNHLIGKSITLTGIMISPLIMRVASFVVNS